MCVCVCVCLPPFCCFFYFDIAYDGGGCIYVYVYVSHVCSAVCVRAGA